MKKETLYSFIALLGIMAAVALIIYYAMQSTF